MRSPILAMLVLCACANQATVSDASLAPRDSGAQIVDALPLDARALDAQRDDASAPLTEDAGAETDTSPRDFDATVPDPERFAFCPTSIDVFGYSNVFFQGCGGAAVPSADLPSGSYRPGTRGYDATLAGMLLQRVMADPELVARFGSDWQIRSCASGGGTLATFVDEEPAGSCGERDRTARYRAMCTDTPAPIVLFSANDVTNLCHGGGMDDVADNEEGFARDWTARFEEFRTDRRPELLFVSPQHEWHGEQGGSLARSEACTWSRPAWNRSGYELWRRTHPEAREVVLVPDLQAEFQRHHPCCAMLGVECAEGWFGPGPGEGDGWVHFGCLGAEALIEHWFTELRAYLLSHEFTCEGAR